MKKRFFAILLTFVALFVLTSCGKKFTVEFNSNGGSPVESQEVKKGKTATKPADPTKSGYTFVEWQLDGAKYDFSSKVTEDITLKAAWKASTSGELSVEFDSNGGSAVETVKVNKGGVVAEPTKPTKDGFLFVEWQLNGVKYDFAQPVTENIKLVAVWRNNQYTPNWPANQQTGWNGNGMEIRILVNPVSEYDPFNANYKAANKAIMQKQLHQVEAAYGVSIVFQQYDDAASWGPNRIKHIKENTASGKFEEDNIYVVNIASSWIPTLVKENCLAPLYNTATEEGVFSEIGYVEQPDGSFVPGAYDQGETSNAVVSVNSQVYGYVQEDPRPDYFLYYNADLIASVGMDDPAELWLKGEWTWSKFEKYAEELQTALSSKGSNYYALAIRPAEFVVGSVTSTGNKIASIGERATLSLTSNSVINRFTAIQSIFSKGQCENVGQSDVPTSFLESRSAIVHGQLWFVGTSNRFNPQKCTFTIGCVPYPTDDNNAGEPIITENASEAILGYDDQPLELVSGSGMYIKGVDMSNSNYNAPYGSAGSYSILNHKNAKNGISPKIVFAIIYDLYEGLGKDPNVAEVDADTAYRNSLLVKFDKELYIDAIMSVQEKTYFELIDLLSMTVGGGSHFGADSFYPVAGTICTKSSVSASTKLGEIVQKYKDAMTQLGYPVA